MVRDMLAVGSVFFLFGGLISQGYTITKQQDSISSLLSLTEAATKIHEDDYEKLWDLHRRVQALEGQDQRIMAHIRWFVMRRSGTDELQKMEAAIEKLEKEERLEQTD